METTTLVGKLIDRTPREVLHYLRRRVLKSERILSFDEKHPCIFVLSTGRAGTQTFSALLSLAENILSYHEPTPTLYGLSRLAYEYKDKLNNDECIKKTFCTAFLTSRKELWDYSLFNGKGYLETSPQVTFLSPIITELITEVRFIYLVRDPREVIRSGMRRGWYGGHPADKTRIVPLPNSDTVRSWGSLTPFQKNCWLWAETNRWIYKFCSSVLKDRFLLVHSEDIFNAKEEIIREVFDFINYPVPSQKYIKKVLRKKLNIQKTGEFPKYADWSGEMKADLHIYTRDIANTIGYSI